MLFTLLEFVIVFTSRLVEFQTYRVTFVIPVESFTAQLKVTGEVSAMLFEEFRVTFVGSISMVILPVPDTLIRLPSEQFTEML